MRNPFITKKYIKKCPYIGTKVFGSFECFKQNNDLKQLMPHNPIVGYFKHNYPIQYIIRPNFKPMVCFTEKTFLNVGNYLFQSQLNCE